MKKVILTIIAVVGIVTLISLPVLAAAYTYQMTMVETSGNTYSSFPFISTVGNSSLVSNGYMSSSGLDTQVVDGSSLPAMLTNTQTLFVDNLNANQNKTFQYTTGNTPATSMPLIVGNGGYITTSESAALEPGSNFSLTCSGLINTSTPVTTGNTLTNGTGGTATGSPVTLANGANTVATTATTLTGSTVANGSGVATGSPITLVSGVNTITVTTLGSFTITLTAGLSGYATSGASCLVTGSPVSLSAGTNSITTTGSTGTFTVNIYANFTVLLQSGISATCASGTATLVGSPIQMGTGSYNIQLSTIGNITITLTESENIVSKSQALTLNVDSSTPGTIDATTYNTSSTASIAGTGGSSAIYSGSVIAVGENFNSGFSSGLTILSDAISLEKGAGSPTGTISCNIYKQSDGSLIGTLGTLDSSTLTGSLVFYTFNSTPVYLGTTTNFIIAAYYNGGNSSNYIVAGVNGTNPYANGQYDTLTGSTWTPVSANDAACQNMTYAVSHAISVTGISSGVHTITLSETTASSGTLSLQVDSGVPSTVTSAGSVASNANTWYLDQSDVMPYIAYYKLTVGGTEVLKYQPITIISGTTLPDLDTGDGVQNGAITFGNNPVGISITLGSFGATAPSQAAAGTNYANQSPGTIISDSITAPPQLYTELDTSLIPLGAAVDAILNAGGIPRALWWFPFIYFGICIAGMMIYEATSPQGVPQMGSLLAMCVAIEVLLVIFGVMGTVGVSGMIPLWSAIMFIFPAGALILSRKHVGWG